MPKYILCMLISRNNFKYAFKNDIGNAFLVSEKGNKGWIYIIENIKKNLDVSKSSIKSVMDSTGPNMINNIFPYIKKNLTCYTLVRMK